MEKLNRCSWAEVNNSEYVKYHDLEWGVPVHDDNVLFEFMVLESAQAGLSWETILNKRDGYRKLFKKFDPKQVAEFTYKDVTRLLKDPSIVRNKLKIEATIANAKAFLKVQEEFGSFSNYMWKWVDNMPIQNEWKSTESLPATTPLATDMSKDLKMRGFKFLGPTVWYAFMQAVGMVNDHSTSCYRHGELRA